MGCVQVRAGSSLVEPCRDGRAEDREPDADLAGPVFGIRAVLIESVVVLNRRQQVYEFRVDRTYLF